MEAAVMNLSSEQFERVGLTRFGGQVDYAACVVLWWWIIVVSYSVGVR